MRSSTFIPRTYPSLSREAILKIRPALCPNPDCKTQRQGPGSGSLGEFIEKLTPSVVLSCLANKVKKKRHLLESFLIFRLFAGSVYFFFPDENSIFPGGTPRRLQSSAYSSR